MRGNFFYVFFILLLFFNLKARDSYSQTPQRFEFFAGYGYYEGLNLGGEFYFLSGKRSVSGSFGYDVFHQNGQESYALSIAFNQAVFQSITNSKDEFKWRLNNKILYTRIEDDYYLWRILSLIPSLNRRMLINDKIKISVDLGPSFNIVLTNFRKTYREVGWPYHVMPDLRVLIIF